MEEVEENSVECPETEGNWKDRPDIAVFKTESEEPHNTVERISLDPDSEPEGSGGYQSAWLQNSESDNELDIDEDGCIVDGEVEALPSKKRCYQFEADPTARKRQCTKLLRRLKCILDEFSTRIGQQVAVIVAQPPTTSVHTIKTYGSKPLQDVITKYHSTIINDLSEALANREPRKPTDPTRFDLPPLIMEGKAVPVEKMTQAQLREFIPIMLRYSTGRGKPGWGKERMRPLWWPDDIPWSNIRLDSRDFTSKTMESWSSTLRRIIIACYKYHDREDLLNEAATLCGMSRSSLENIADSRNEGVKPTETHVLPGPPPLEKIVHEDGSISVYVPKPTDTRHVILTDTDGQEYCVEISVPNTATSAVFANFQMTPTEAPLQQVSIGPGHVVSLSN